jgi:hypothetical protein
MATLVMRITASPGAKKHPADRDSYEPQHSEIRNVPEGDQQPASGHCLEQLRFLAPFNESHTVPVEHIVDTGPREFDLSSLRVTRRI